MSIKAAIVKVFSDEKGNYGNPVGIVIDTDGILSPQERLTITQKLAFSETIFINNLDNTNVSIYNPKEEVAYAGHALLGVAWFIINRLGNQITIIKTPKNESSIDVKALLYT